MATRSSFWKMVLGGLWGLSALGLAYLSWTEAHYAFLRGSNTVAAHDARPQEAASLGKFIDQRLEHQPGSHISDQEDRAVRAALREAPLSRVLLRIVGLKAEQDGDIARADKALGLSNTLSRRDALTQLSLIERAVSKQDMDAAVLHYHAALSVHPELGPLLYPILAKAIDFPDVRKALSPYLASQARWSADLLNTAVTQGNPVSVAELIIPIGDIVRGDIYDPINARLMGKLTQAGNFALAGKLTVAVIPNFSLASLASFKVSEATTDKRLGSLGWKLAEEGRILASANNLGGFDVDIDPLTHGNVASRTISVIGGKVYAFRQTLRGISASDSAASLNWQGTCVPQRKIVWQQTLPRPTRTQRQEFEIAVPTDCKGIEFVLSARGPEGQQAAHVVFEAFDLTPRAN